MATKFAAEAFSSVRDAIFEEIGGLYVRQDSSVLDRLGTTEKLGFQWLLNLFAPKLGPVDDVEGWKLDALLLFSHRGIVECSLDRSPELLRWADSVGATEFAQLICTKFNLHAMRRQNSLQAELHKADVYKYQGSVPLLGRHITKKSVSESYAVECEILGRGLSGPVRMAVHKESQRTVAVKTLRLDNVSPRQRKNILDEVAIFMSLDHPNIVKLLEIYENQHPYECIHLVMEYCSGRELHKRLSEKHRYSERDAVRVTKSMLSALKYLHSFRIIHRDIKLENWVFSSADADADLRLIDFGFSRFLYEGATLSAILGTVHYVAPEVLRGCYDFSCDMWSLGVVVYMLLSGRPPFLASSDNQVVKLIERGEYALTGSEWGAVSTDAREFIQMLLKTNPAERLCAADALQHKWIRTPDQVLVESVELDLSVLRSMCAYAHANSMKRAALSLIAFSMTMDEIHDLEDQFRFMDMDDTGTIKVSDMCAMLGEHLQLPREESEQIFKRCDQTGDQHIHFTEFLAAALQARVQLDDQRIQKVFNRLDYDGTGLITLENLQSVFGEKYNGAKVEEIIHECSENGTIDFDAFALLVRSEENLQLRRGNSTDATDVPDDDSEAEGGSVNVSPSSAASVSTAGRASASTSTGGRLSVSHRSPHPRARRSHGGAGSQLGSEC